MFWGAQGASQLPGCEGGGVVVGFCFGGRRGPVSFRAVKGKGGESALELSCSAGNGGESASGAVKGG